MPADTRIIGYDIMRIVAATMVICIHSNVYFLEKCADQRQWLIIMIMTALCVVSVPLFFMVSGAGNLVKEDVISIKRLLKVKIPKVFIPFLIWSIIYVVLRIAMGKIEATTEAFTSLIHEPAYYQFWFMYSLLGLYLCIPFFQYIVINANKRLLQYIIAFWMISSLVLPMLERYIPGFKLSSHFNLIFLEGYWGYFFAGGYLRKYPPRHDKKVGLILLVVGLAITAASAVIEWLYTPPAQYYGYVYCAYLLPGAAMMSIGLFLLLQRLRVRVFWRDIIYYLSGLTMGIFYVHTILVNGYEMIFKDVAPTPLNAVIKLLVVFCSAILICAVLKAIKPINKYLL